MNKASILLVDDRREDLLVLEEILASPDYDMVSVRSGTDALRHLLRQEFAIVLLDVQMSEMNGFETAKLIRQREKNRNVPIIFVTGHQPGSGHEEQGYTLNAVDYIVKPFNPDILRTKVGVFVELYQKTAQLEDAMRQLQRERERTEELEREKEMRSLDQFSSPLQRTVTGQSRKNVLISESAPETFAELTEFYGGLLELALEERAYRVDHNISEALRSLSDQVGQLNATPRDVVEIHKTMLRAKTNGSTPEKAKAYIQEGRLIVLELMGYLVSFYRNQL